MAGILVVDDQDVQDLNEGLNALLEDDDVTSEELERLEDLKKRLLQVEVNG